MAEGQNRVLIGLPERLEKAKGAVFALEAELKEANLVIESTKVILEALAKSGDPIFIERLFDMYGITG